MNERQVLQIARESLHQKIQERIKENSRTSAQLSFELDQAYDELRNLDLHLEVDPKDKEMMVYVRNHASRIVRDYEKMPEDQISPRIQKYVERVTKPKEKLK